MRVLTGVPGRYDRNAFKYQPPARYHNWLQVVEHTGAGITTAGTLLTLP